MERALCGEFRDLWFELEEARKAAARSLHSSTTPPNTPSPCAVGKEVRRLRVAARHAKRQRYSRAMSALLSDSLRDANNPDIRAAILDLHPAPPIPVYPVPEAELPPVPEIDAAQVEKALRKMDQWAAAGPTAMTSRYLQRLLQARASVTAGVTGIGALTHLVRRYANGRVPDSVLPLISAVRAVPVRKPNGRIRPIAIGNTQRRLVTQVLLPASIVSSRENLHPEQVCNGVRSGADALVHETREFLEEYADDDDFVVVSIDARNAFKMFSQQKMLDAARE
jgi:hypothetical protein